MNCRSGKYQSAITDFQQLRNPNEQSRAYAGLAYVETGDFETALSVTNSDDPKCRSIKCLALQRSRQYDELVFEATLALKQVADDDRDSLAECIFENAG